MTVKPILFSTEMVQTILEGRKTQTRRIVKSKYCNTDLVKANNILYERQNDVPPPYENENGRTTHKVRMNEECIPQYQIGDILYVRETWADDLFNIDKFHYKADGEQDCEFRGKWHPSIHMPKKAARIFLEVTDVRCERLQDISEKDAYAEGVIKEHSPIPKGAIWSDTVGKASLEAFKSLWIYLYGEQSWNDNPFVWVYEFKIVERPKEF